MPKQLSGRIATGPLGLFKWRALREESRLAFTLPPLFLQSRRQPGHLRAQRLHFLPQLSTPVIRFLPAGHPWPWRIPTPHLGASPTG